MPSLVGHSSWLLAQIYPWLSKPMGHPRCPKEIKMTLFTLKSIVYIYWGVWKKMKNVLEFKEWFDFSRDVFDGLVKISNEREGLHPPWRTIPKVSILKDWLCIFSMLNFGLHEYKGKHVGGGGSRRDIYTSCKSTTNGFTSNGKWRLLFSSPFWECVGKYICA
jgi:hypothetical protein